MRKSVELKAVYDKDLEQVLESLGILGKLIEGELTCAVCGCEVDLDNLGAIFPESDEVCVSCDKDKCIRTVTTHAAGELSA